MGGRAAAMLFRWTGPSSSDEDSRRREFILNIILILSMALLAAFCVISLYDRFLIDPRASIGRFLGPFVASMVFCGLLLALSKRGQARLASHLFIASYFAGAVYIGWTWGASLPTTLLLSALILVTSSVLIGSTFGFIAAGAVIISLIALGIHESLVLNVPYWRYEEITLTDVVAYSTLLAFMSFITWLSNREIGRSLARARASEKALESERNSLERRVADRTREFIASERARMSDIDRIAEFGRLSGGLFHDLMSPLTAVALQIERLSEKKTSVSEVKELIAQTVSASRRMRSLMDAVRQGLRSASDDDLMGAAEAHLERELQAALDILAYKARMAGMRITVKKRASADIVICGQPLRIYQLFLNLISNAIDSFADDSARKDIEISMADGPDHALISVKDCGRGMSDACRQRIFSKQFTTKADGTGIGLLTVKSIVDDLDGVISVESTEGRGTTFTITIPRERHLDLEP